MGGLLKTVYPVPRLVTTPNLFAGTKALAALKGVTCSRVLLLTGSSLSEQLRAEIKKSLACDTVIEATRPPGGDPSLASAQTIWNSLDGKTPDCIVAVGGGGVLDLGKLILLLLEWPDATMERMSRPFGLPAIKKRTRMVAIPTTAGSGSEVSSSALIIDDKTGIKTAIVSHDLLYDVALLEPRFLLQIPRKVMVASMVDAMTHAVEGYISSVNNPLADVLAVSAITNLARFSVLWLAGAEDDLDSIQQLLIASHQAGMVQNQCGVGICHSLAHQMGFSDISHGEANGIFLPMVLDFNQQEPAVADRLLNLAELTQVDILAWLQQMQTAGGLARSLGDIPAITTATKQKIAQNALDDICTKFNPRMVVLEDFALLLQQNLPAEAN